MSNWVLPFNLSALPVASENVRSKRLGFFVGSTVSVATVAKVASGYEEIDANFSWLNWKTNLPSTSLIQVPFSLASSFLTSSDIAGCSVARLMDISKVLTISHFKADIFWRSLAGMLDVL